MIGNNLEIPKKLKEEVFVKLVNGPLFFGSTSDLQELSNEIPSTATTVIIRMERMPYIDHSGLYMLEDMLTELGRKKITVVIVGLQDQARHMMERIDIIPKLVDPLLIFDNLNDCSRWIKENVKDVYPPQEN